MRCLGRTHLWGWPSHLDFEQSTSSGVPCERADSNVMDILFDKPAQHIINVWAGSGSEPVLVRQFQVRWVQFKELVDSRLDFCLRYFMTLQDIPGQRQMHLAMQSHLRVLICDLSVRYIGDAPVECVDAERLGLTKRSVSIEQQKLVGIYFRR